MTKPQMPWDSQEAFGSNVVWWARLDDRFQVEIIRATAYEGELRIFDHGKEDKLLHLEPITFAYEAKFGPDIGDVADWQDKAVAFVDSLTS